MGNDLRMAKRKSPGMDAARVEELLRARQWLKADLARAIDVDDERMTKWLKWGQSPSGYDAARICIALYVDIADLYQIQREATMSSELRSVLALLSPEERGAVLGFARALAVKSRPAPNARPSAIQARRRTVRKA